MVTNKLKVVIPLQLGRSSSPQQILHRPDHLATSFGFYFKLLFSTPNR